MSSVAVKPETGTVSEEKVSGIEKEEITGGVISTGDTVAVFIRILEVNGCRVSELETVLPSMSLKVEFPRLKLLACLVLLYTSCKSFSDVIGTGEVFELMSCFE